MRMMRICGSMPIAHRCACENQTNAKKTTIPHLISPSIYAEMHVLELDLADGCLNEEMISSLAALLVYPFTLCDFSYCG